MLSIPSRINWDTDFQNLEDIGVNLTDQSWGNGEDMGRKSPGPRMTCAHRNRSGTLNAYGSSSYG